MEGHDCVLDVVVGMGRWAGVAEIISRGILGWALKEELKIALT